MKAKERVLFDNYDRNFDEYKKDYEANFPEEEYTMDMFYEDGERDWEDLLCEIENFDNARRYILYGSVGLWYGNRHGSKMFKSISEAISYAIEDCDFIKIYDTNGVFNITCSHHDGTNCFELKEVTDKGIEYYDRWEYNWSDKRNESHVNEQIIKRYSKHLNFAHKVYGCKVREYERKEV